jgi:hypothetical protein
VAKGIQGSALWEERGQGHPERVLRLEAVCRSGLRSTCCTTVERTRQVLRVLVILNDGLPTLVNYPIRQELAAQPEAPPQAQRKRAFSGNIEPQQWQVLICWGSRLKRDRSLSLIPLFASLRPPLAFLSF